MSSYYDRRVHLDAEGNRVFRNADDENNGNVVLGLVEEKWKCKTHKFPSLHPIDAYAERSGQLVALIEVKSRSKPHNKYSTVILNSRKLLALQMGSMGLGVPAFFMVRFADGVIKYIDIWHVGGAKVTIGGCSRRVKSDSDIEPILLIEMDQMKTL